MPRTSYSGDKCTARAGEEGRFARKTGPLSERAHGSWSSATLPRDPAQANERGRGQQGSPSLLVSCAGTGLGWLEREPPTSNPSRMQPLQSPRFPSLPCTCLTSPIICLAHRPPVTLTTTPATSAPPPPKPTHHPPSRPSQRCMRPAQSAQHVAER